MMARNILKYSSNFPTICYSQRRLASCGGSQTRASELFTLEQRRQFDQIGRIEKIEVRYLGTPHDTTLIMNRGLSTPYDCAKHLGEKYCKISALALLDSSKSWDMHRPLQDSCTLQLLNFTIADPNSVNRAFWRTCSFLLGAVLQETFKEEAGLCLHSFPVPNVKSGSFIHDICLSHKNWKPSIDELRALSIGMIKLAQKDLKIERLEVSNELALEMFKENPFKCEQLPSISQQNNGLVNVYRTGNHVDISKGPMVSSTNFIGKCTISSVHALPNTENNGLWFYRVQGVALPIGLNVNHFVYGILEERSRKLNSARLPTEPFEDSIMEIAA